MGNILQLNETLIVILLDVGLQYIDI